MLLMNGIKTVMWRWWADEGATTRGGPMARPDHMVLTAFVSASVTKGGLTSWMHSRADRGILDASFYIQLAQGLERSGFDLMFFDDRLAMPAAYQGSIDETIKRGSRAIKLDLITILG